MNPSDYPDTVTDAIELLRAQGYTAEFELVEGALIASREQASCTVGEAEVERLFRFEGPSDPGDEMIVFGVRDPASGTRGTLAAAFGPAADPARTGHLSDLRKRFEPRH
jgi:hypothetical protein